LLLLSGGAAVATLVAASRLSHVISTGTIGLVDRLAISAYGLAFYLWKTVLPVGLSPLYELPPRIEATAWPFVVAGAVVVLVTALAVLVRRRWPALAAAWAAYVVILLPVVGIVQNGPQIAADRYTYLACGGWALLAGGGVRAGWRAWRDGRLARWAAAALASVVITALAALAALTWIQTGVWRDSETLWRHALATRPSAIVHFKLGTIDAHRGDIARAVERFREALRINPAYARGHAALGFALMFRGQTAEATEHFRYAVRLDPREAEAHSGLGLVLDRQGDLAGAAEHFGLALAVNPRDAVTHVNLGLVRMRQDRLPEATAHLEQAVRLAPGLADAHNHLGRALAAQGRAAEAAEHFRAAARLDPGLPRTNLEAAGSNGRR
jgi:Flp pilus assembly protein TadD